jgi:hypothetical protein
MASQDNASVHPAPFVDPASVHVIDHLGDIILVIPAVKKVNRTTEPATPVAEQQERQENATDVEVGDVEMAQTDSDDEVSADEH